MARYSLSNGIVLAFQTEEAALRAPLALLALDILLAGCSLPNSLRPTEPAGLAYFKADAVTQAGQPTAVVARLILPHPGYGEATLSASVDESARTVSLAGTIKDLTPSGAGNAAVIAFADAATRVTLKSAGTYRVQAPVSPFDWQGPSDFSHLHPVIERQIGMVSTVDAWQEIQVVP